MKYVKSFCESASQKLYKYLGKENSTIWTNNLRDILENKILISNKPYISNEINKSHLMEIDKLLSILGNKKHVLYSDISGVVNSRFGNCWFINTTETYPDKYDICIQTFEDNWYLVNINWGFADNWYLCDDFEGLTQLIEDIKNSRVKHF